MRMNIITKYDIPAFPKPLADILRQYDHVVNRLYLKRAKYEASVEGDSEQTVGFPITELYLVQHAWEAPETEHARLADELYWFRKEHYILDPSPYSWTGCAPLMILPVNWGSAQEMADLIRQEFQHADTNIDQKLRFEYWEPS